eukprot:Polyplicarium_translucidae@DN3473_c0_g1_i1.p1
MNLGSAPHDILFVVTTFLRIGDWLKLRCLCTEVKKALTPAWPLWAQGCNELNFAKFRVFHRRVDGRETRAKKVRNSEWFLTAPMQLKEFPWRQFLFMNLAVRKTQEIRSDLSFEYQWKRLGRAIWILVPCACGRTGVSRDIQRFHTGSNQRLESQQITEIRHRHHSVSGRGGRLFDIIFMVQQAKSVSLIGSMRNVEFAAVRPHDSRVAMCKARGVSQEVATRAFLEFSAELQAEVPSVFCRDGTAVPD